MMSSNDKQINSLYELITKENMQTLESANFNVKDYKEILDEITAESLENLEIDYDNTPLENIKNITKQHVNIYYSEQEISSGYYIYNKIYLNNNQPESQQIVTLIHELTHHIYAEIFEKTLERLFDISNYHLIESFVMFMLNNSIENRIADEYLSYIVEGRFTPDKYHNYLPFIQLLIEYGIDVDKNKHFFIFAHEISHDIDDILRCVITDKLVKQIHDQFVEDNIDEFNQKLTFDYPEERYDDNEKVEIIIEMIYFIFDYFVNGEGNIDELVEYVDKFDDKN